MQDQLLHTPIHDLSNVELVSRGALDFVNPAELPGLPAGTAEDAKNLSVQRQLVQAAGERVGSIQHLIRTGRDTDGPGSALVLASGSLGRRHRTHPWTRAGRERHVKFDFP